MGPVASDAAVHIPPTLKKNLNALGGRSPAVGDSRNFLLFQECRSSSLADPGEQLTKVLEFRRRLQESHQVLYRTFGTATDFARELENHLLAFSNGELPNPRTPGTSFTSSDFIDHAPETGRTYDSHSTTGLTAANSGHMEVAVSLFARFHKQHAILRYWILHEDFLNCRAI